ncbi:hypothetical protein [Bradyrhizobium sp. dw_78]|uniref:hypothetical protein n=1 Tax=Bradyrhizobium sp. dw_78 TaxID=2719793 RepID=UPI001BD621FF|nr:hypothetical protein [Bradyrhizobium sp. dw_78]
MKILGKQSVVVAAFAIAGDRRNAAAPESETAILHSVILAASQPIFCRYAGAANQPIVPDRDDLRPKLLRS